MAQSKFPERSTDITSNGYKSFLKRVEGDDTKILSYFIINDSF